MHLGYTPSYYGIRVATKKQANPEMLKLGILRWGRAGSLCGVNTCLLLRFTLYYSGSNQTYELLFVKYIRYAQWGEHSMVLLFLHSAGGLNVDGGLLVILSWFYVLLAKLRFGVTRP